MINWLIAAIVAVSMAISVYTAIGITVVANTKPEQTVIYRYSPEPKIPVYDPPTRWSM